jgi:hypothetical protein
MYRVAEKKKLMYGKHAVVHESRYFIQARRVLRRATMLTWNAALYRANYSLTQNHYNKMNVLWKD